jgi:outer membrane PBP1 activator LpoA protein
LKNDIKQYNILKNKYYIIHWDVLSGNPRAIDLLRDKIEEEKKIPKKKFDRLDDNEKINWAKLSASAEPKVIQLLEENPTKIVWFTLSANPKAIKLLEENPTKINWPQLSKNPKAIKLLKKELKENPENIGWYQLSKNPEAISILDKNRDKIIWSQFSENPNAGELLKDRIDFEGKLPQKKYNQLTNYSKLNWIALSLNPSIFTLS